MLSVVSTNDDILSLSDQINDIGAGLLPPQEIPVRLSTSTPEDVEKEFKPFRDKLMHHLAALLKENESLTGFCTGEGSTIFLSVRKEDERHLYLRQYPMSQSIIEAVRLVLMRWLKEGRIAYAPTGCRFNSPLLAVRKKDEKGNMTGIRVCIDIRRLNMYLLEDDKFQIPHIPDMLATLAGGKIFGEFDLSEAYFQFKIDVDSQPYTAFTWDKQQYVFIGCPYGIKHIPSLFQRFISHLFRDMPSML